MKLRTDKPRLARETLRWLSEGRDPSGPIGTEPASVGPTDCHTASCRIHTC
jgi:hypothetical protein